MLVAEAPFLAARGGGGGRTPCAGAGRLQEFDYFVVVDFEAACEKDERIYPQEIIEFPSVLVDGATDRLASAFRRYVRPQHHPVLTEFCRDLTGIRQADVDAGVELDEALRLHNAWLEAVAVAVAGAKKGGRFAVVTWRDWDCRTMLESECRFKGPAKPGYFDRWINLRVPFEVAFGCGGGGRRATLQEAVRAAGLKWEGRLHCGLDDTRNTALLLTELMRLGVKLSITGSLAPPPQQQQQQKLPPQPQVSTCSGAAAVCLCYCGVASRGGLVVVPGPMQGKCFLGCAGLGPWEPCALSSCGAATERTATWMENFSWIVSVNCTDQNVVSLVLKM